MADEQYKVSYSVDVNESGQSRLQQILEKNEQLASSMASSFDSAVASLEAYKKKFSEELPAIFGGNSSVVEGSTQGGLNLVLNMDKANQEFDDFVAKASKPIQLTANASGIVSAANSALESVYAMFDQTFYINANANVNVDENDGKKKTKSGGSKDSDTGSAFLKMSTGGRFSNPTSVQVAEDGDAEYIIPVKKEGRALPLLRQLLGELSPEARKSLIGSGSGLVSSASVSSVGGVQVSAGQNTNTVSAPVTINVNASGSDASRIGESIYNTAERYLLRTMKGVFA